MFVIDVSICKYRLPYMILGVIKSPEVMKVVPLTSKLQ